MKKLIIISIVLFIQSAKVFSQEQPNHKPEIIKDTIPNPYINAEIEIKTYQNTDEFGGWGYDIYITKTRYIHQPHIPAINGNKGFSSEKNAKTLAELAVYKIRKNQMPPTISVSELDSLGVLK